MKRCVPAASGRVCAVLVIAACGAGSAFFLRMLFSEEGFQPPLLFMGIALAGVAAHLLWSMVSKGNWGFFYNEERIVFVLSRKDRREYCWKELPEAGVTFLYPTAFCPNGTFFFSGKRKGWQMVVTPQMTEYKEFLAMIQRKGVPAPGAIPLGTREPNVEEVFRTVFGGEFGGKDKGQK